MVSHPTADQLTAAALPGEPADPEVTAHLATCARCAAEVDALRRTVGHARDGMTMDVLPPPRPEVWEGVLARLGEDAPARPAPVAPAPAPPPDPPAHDAPPPDAPPPDAPQPRRRVLGVGLAAALAVVALVVGIVVGVVVGGDDRPEAPTTVALVADRAGVAGEVVREDAGVRVEVTLPGPAPAGHDLEVWDIDSGTPRSLGVLQPAAGRERWAGDLALLAADGPMPRLDVSLEPTGAGPEHSGQSLAHTP
ncbi:anti-sigma factor domain-containing protein [Actinomycetospora straminea]|uniref:Anti-sigma-K factor rskA n=1 Tax=Actinomycetospora straminea TaxID=663607 RepID=A0ABP9EQX3_9PSEU|nr:anti-sigma factor [Actinomycetospora straminea]MDD7934049.1 anti-sigma factor [Actinomycetospora straminea]